ncbi:MAG: hypothetical protein WCO66_04595 [Candidatus Absconditabacteria bacterium]
MKQYLTPIKVGSLNDVRIGSHIVFEEIDEQGNLHQCTGLEYIIQIENMTVVDNHDRVLEFWTKGLPVIHIDQHTDMRPVGDGVNVGNFLRYALDTGFIPGSTQINTEYSLLNFKVPEHPYILDIDLDFRDPDMSIEAFDKTIQICKGLIANAQIITIATSPYFIEQKLALRLLHKLLS